MADVYNPYGALDALYGMPSYGYDSMQPLSLQRLISMVRDIQASMQPLGNQTLGNAPMVSAAPMATSQIPGQVMSNTMGMGNRLLSMPRQQMTASPTQPQPNLSPYANTPAATGTPSLAPTPVSAIAQAGGGGGGGTHVNLNAPTYADMMKGMPSLPTAQPTPSPSGGNTYIAPPPVATPGYKKTVATQRQLMGFNPSPWGSQGASGLVDYRGIGGGYA